MRRYGRYWHLVFLVALWGGGCSKPNQYDPFDPALSGGPAVQPGGANEKKDGPMRPAPTDPMPGEPGMAGAADGPPSACDEKACDTALSDGCCPAGCTAATDSDCSVNCGNGIIEMGETCDPQSSCPIGCTNRACTSFELQGTAGMCNARCVEGPPIAICKDGDGCCPSTCNATTDKDCLIECGNGAKEGSETCDPLDSCPASCPQQVCNLFKLVNPGTCTAECVPDGQQTRCVAGDGCCPGTCNANNDSDCQAKCGNGVKEDGEACDPCPTSCAQQECQIRKVDMAGTCNARCVNDRLQTQCMNGDGCCPGGCDLESDNDCTSCINGEIACGGRCIACPNAANGRSGCQNGRCEVLSCDGGFYECEGRCVQNGERCGNSCGSGFRLCPNNSCVSTAAGSCCGREECPDNTCDGQNTVVTFQCSSGKCQRSTSNCSGGGSCRNDALFERRCRNAGDCSDTEVRRCGIRCNGNGCLDSCARDEFREGNNCVPKRGRNGACSNGGQCQSGNCVGNSRCCDGGERVCNDRCIGANECCPACTSGFECKNRSCQRCGGTQENCCGSGDECEGNGRCSNGKCCPPDREFIDGECRVPCGKLEGGPCCAGHVCQRPGLRCECINGEFEVGKCQKPRSRGTPLHEAGCQYHDSCGYDEHCDFNTFLCEPGRPDDEFGYSCSPAPR
jgi:hypothetical protein